MSQTTIRPFQPDDSPAVSALIIRCLKEVNQADYTPQQIERLCQAFAPDQVKKRFGQRLSFVALQKGQIIGTVTLKQNEIGSLFILPDYHKRGIGQQLLRHIEQVALQNKQTEVIAYSSLTAIDFYQHHGYTQIDQKEEADGEISLKIQKYLS